MTSSVVIKINSVAASLQNTAPVDISQHQQTISGMEEVAGRHGSSISCNKLENFNRFPCLFYFLNSCSFDFVVFKIHFYYEAISFWFSLKPIT